MPSEVLGARFRGLGFRIKPTSREAKKAITALNTVRGCRRVAPTTGSRLCPGHPFPWRQRLYGKAVVMSPRACQKIEETSHRPQAVEERPVNNGPLMSRGVPMLESFL